MKRIATVLALALLAAPAAADDAKPLFGARCAACHGPDGKGQTTMGKKLGAQDLTQVKLSPAAAAKVIENGKGKMTPFKGKLSPEQIDALAKYVAGGLK